MNILAKTGMAVGIGLIAGLAGTAAISASQTIEMKLTGRKPSSSPVKVASKVLDIKPVSEEKTAKVSEEIHWAYGTSLGIIRGFYGLIGLKGWLATLTHFVTVWGIENVMLPGLDVSPPFTEWSGKEILTDGIHHAVYAVATGLVFDAIDPGI